MGLFDFLQGLGPDIARSGVLWWAAIVGVTPVMLKYLRIGDVLLGVTRALTGRMWVSQMRKAHASDAQLRRFIDEYAHRDQVRSGRPR